MTTNIYSSKTPVAVLTAERMGRSGLGLLDYFAPEQGCVVGDYLEVPLGKRRVLGVVWGDPLGDVDPSKLRSAYRVLDVPPMREELRLFLTRAAEYTFTPLPTMLRLATRAPGVLEKTVLQRLYHLTPLADSYADQLTPARRRVLAALRDWAQTNPDMPTMGLSALTQAAGCGAAVVKGLVTLGLVQEVNAPKDRPYPTLSPDLEHGRLEGAQIAAAQALKAGVRTEAYSSTLLWGVTGSGKTEVYLETVGECLRQGGQVLVLLPEIALTADFMARVEARFGARPAEWHSGMPPAERRRLWRMCAEGGVSLVVGARSALFLPFQNLRMIVVDEEHDNSYKQEEGVFYNTRDMAVLRGSICGASVILASATPSLESWANAQSGKYARVDLPVRYGAAQMPQLHTVDMRGVKLPPGQWLSPQVLQAVTARLGVQEQSLLFLNRRGYAPVTLCRSCGQVVGCQDCDSRLVEHRTQKRLICHQCGASHPIPNACPACQAEGSLSPIGPGVERLMEEVTQHFPQARVALLSSDQFTTANAVKEAIGQIARGDVDIIIGTQLVAKGHNFPLLTLVAVIDADLGLQGSDMRAAERTFQLISQVAGRAGRIGAKKGEVLLQTHQPDHPVIRALLRADAEAFLKAEAAERACAGSPPYGRMAGLIISAEQAAEAFDFATMLSRRAEALHKEGIALYGPAPAPLSRVRGRYRVRLLVKARKEARLHAALKAWLEPIKVPNTIRLAVDIDPQNFL